MEGEKSMPFPFTGIIINNAVSISSSEDIKKKHIEANIKKKQKERNRQQGNMVHKQTNKQKNK